MAAVASSKMVDETDVKSQLRLLTRPIPSLFSGPAAQYQLLPSLESKSRFMQESADWQKLDEITRNLYRSTTEEIAVKEFSKLKTLPEQIKFIESSSWDLLGKPKKLQIIDNLENSIQLELKKPEYHSAAISFENSNKVNFFTNVLAFLSKEKLKLTQISSLETSRWNSLFE